MTSDDVKRVPYLVQEINKLLQFRTVRVRIPGRALESRTSGGVDRERTFSARFPCGDP